MNDPIQAVLADTADALDAMEPYRKARIDNSHVAGHVYRQMYESSSRLYGATAIEHLESSLPVSQLQFWDVETLDEVVPVLRKAAGLTPEPGLDVAALRRQLREIHRRLSDALGGDVETASIGDVVNQVVRKLQRLSDTTTTNPEKEN